MSNQGKSIRPAGRNKMIFIGEGAQNSVKQHLKIQTLNHYYSEGRENLEPYFKPLLYFDYTNS